MVALDRHRVTWSGFAGGPGVSTFYTPTGSAMNTALHAFFLAVVADIPSTVTLKVEASGDTIESTTGALVGSWVDTNTATVTGSAVGSYSAVSGLLMRWGTATFLSGRRLRGHTFIVPVPGTVYDAAGIIGTAHVTAWNAAAAALITSLGPLFVIWQRPRRAQVAYTDRRGAVHPAITARGGGYGPVITGTARDQVTELRSRRD